MLIGIFVLAFEEIFKQKRRRKEEIFEQKRRRKEEIFVKISLLQSLRKC